MKKIALAALLVAAPLLAQNGPGRGNGNGPGAAGTPAVPAVSPLVTYVQSLPKETLSSAETTQIAYFREEEKLARDVYRALFAANGDRAFANVAAAEQRHMDEVKLLLDRYGLADPAATTAPGEFRDGRLASLYVDLVARGKASLVEAFKAGATIEDLDLSDVGKALDAADNRDVDTILQNLAKGSRNHLRAFSSRLAALGSPYAAQYLPADEVAKIVAAAHERGAYDENGKLLAGTAACAGQAGQGGMGHGHRGAGAGNGTGLCTGTGPGAGNGAGNGAGFGPGNGTCPNR